MIVPDYAEPSALMVPHAPTTVLATLEEIASAASRAVGVILLSANPAASEAFVAKQVDPSRFSIVAAEFDSPWIRDRSPVPVRTRDGYRWIVPTLRSKRERDDALFHRIIARSAERVPLAFLRGNIVAGPRGVALSTTQLLEENGLGDEAALEPISRALGIRHWLIVPRFTEESTGHVDVCARFLSSRLLAVSWNAARAQDQAVAAAVEEQVRAAVPDVHTIRVPLHAQGDRYASLVNWIQLGRLLLVPRYTSTPTADLEQAELVLRGEGYRVQFIDSPTEELGGGLHCLTASIYT